MHEENSLAQHINTLKKKKNPLQSHLIVPIYTISHVYLHIYKAINRNDSRSPARFHFRQNKPTPLFVLHAVDKSAELCVFVRFFLFLSVCVAIFASHHLGSRPGSLLYLLMLTPHSKPVDMHRNGHHDFGISHRFS